MGIEKGETNVNRNRKPFLSAGEEEWEMENTLSSMNEEAEPYPGFIGYYLHCVGEDRVKFTFGLFIYSLEAAFTYSNVYLVSTKG